jgi:hypothetical protein
MRLTLLASAVVLIAIGVTPRELLADSAHEYEFIGKVNIPDDNFLYINAPSNFINDDNCSNPWYAVSKHPLSDDRTRAQLQVALASFLGHKKVFVHAIGCSADGRLLLDTIQIEQP